MIHFGCRHCFKALAEFFHHVFNNLIHLPRRAFAHATNMASRHDSKMASPLHRPSKRQMVHLKTKEECRLGNETIQVWTVELPSKHAEGVLRYVDILSLSLPSAHLPSQSD